MEEKIKELEIKTKKSSSIEFSIVKPEPWSDDGSYADIRFSVTMDGNNLLLYLVNHKGDLDSMSDEVYEALGKLMEPGKQFRRISPHIQSYLLTRVKQLHLYFDMRGASPFNQLRLRVLRLLIKLGIQWKLQRYTVLVKKLLRRVFHVVDLERIGNKVNTGSTSLNRGAQTAHLWGSPLAFVWIEHLLWKTCKLPHMASKVIIFVNLKFSCRISIIKKVDSTVGNGSCNGTTKSWSAESKRNEVLRSSSNTSGNSKFRDSSSGSYSSTDHKRKEIKSPAQENPSLITVRSTDLLPSSWMAVAWYQYGKLEEELGGMNEMEMGKTVGAITLVLAKPWMELSPTKFIFWVAKVTQWVNEISRFTLTGSNKVLVYHGSKRGRCLDKSEQGYERDWSGDSDKRPGDKSNHDREMYDREHGYRENRYHQYSEHRYREHRYRDHQTPVQGAWVQGGKG
ncbi:hypothetical protein ACET3Z_001643 [Daucus carota]